MTTATKYAKEAVHFYGSDPEDDWVASCPEGLHEEDRYLPGFVYRVRRTDSDADVSRYERSFELAQSNQGKNFTWKHYLGLLRQMWSHNSNDLVQSPLVKLPKSRNTPHHFVSYNKYYTASEDSDKESCKISAPLGDVYKKHRQRTEKRDHCKKSSRRNAELECKKSSQRNAELEDFYTKVPQRNTVPEDYCKHSFQSISACEYSHKTSKRNLKPGPFTKKPLQRISMAENFGRKSFHEIPENFGKKSFHRYNTSEYFDAKESLKKSRFNDSFKEGYQRNTVFTDPSKRDSGFHDNFKETTKRNIRSRDSYQKSPTKGKNTKGSHKKASKRNSPTEISDKKLSEKSKQDKTYFRKEFDDDEENISTVDTVLFVTPMPKMFPDVSRYITPPESQSWWRKSTRCSSVDSPMKTPQGSKWRKKLSFIKGFDSESISSVDSFLYTTALSKINLEDDSSYCSHSDSESNIVKSILRRSISIRKNDGSPKGFRKETPQRKKWQRSSLFKKKVDFDTNSISSEDSNILPLTPLVKRLYAKMSTKTDDSGMEDAPIKSRKKVKDKKKYLQPLEDEPIYAKVHKKGQSSRNASSKEKVPKEYLHYFENENTWAKSLTPGNTRPRSMTTSTPKYYPKRDDEFVNELQHKVKLSLWRRLKTFVKKEFRTNKKSFTKNFSSRKSFAIEV